ncbi:MAG: Ig-like domain-containing protein [Thermoplasmatota archaeon]
MKPVEVHRILVVVMISALLTASMLAHISTSIGLQAPAIPDDYHPGIIRVNAAYPNGSPAVCYDVFVYSYGETTPLSTNCTDSTGFAELSVNFADLGHLTVFLSTAGANFDKTHVTLGPDDVISIDLTANLGLDPEVFIVGTVRDALTDWPLGYINLTIEGIDLYGNDHFGYYLTNTDGKFNFSVPISDQPYELSLQSGSLYMSYDVDVFVGTDPGTVTHDIFLYPTYSPDNPFKMRFIDAGSSNPYHDGQLQIMGYVTGLGQGQYYYNAETNETVNGWYETYLNFGEYSATWSIDLGDFNVQLYWWSYLYVNHTEVSMEIPIDTPGWKQVELEVWNETEPQEWSYIGYSTNIICETGKMTASTWNFTDTGGETAIFVPDDRTTLVEIYGKDGEYTIVEVDPSGPEPIHVNVSLETKEEPPVIEGNVKITVKDRQTDVKVPLARISMFYVGPGDPTVYYEYADISGEFIGKARVGMYSALEAFCDFGKGKLDGLEVSSEGVTEATIYIDRYPALPDVRDAYFYLKDEAGNPVPNLMLQIDHPLGEKNVYLTLVSGGDGKVSFMAPAGDIDINIMSLGGTYRPKWALPVKSWNVPEGGGQMEDVIVYPTAPLEQIWGFVKEKGSGRPIPNAFTASHPFRLLEDVDDEFDPFGYIPSLPETLVPLFWEGSGSVVNGFYRFWGRDTTFMYCMASGYFPVIERMELGTRAEYRHDFLLEEIPLFDIFINGTLVNSEDEPIPGYVEVHDLDHDLYHVGGSDPKTTGEFSIPAYPGRFRIIFGNDTLQDRVEMEVGSEGVEDLVLKLVPRAGLSGIVTNWNGTVLPGINVTIQRIVGDEHEMIDWEWTGEAGEFSFRVPAGEYRLVIMYNELYNDYLGDPFTTDGWTDIIMDAVLANRTYGDIEGHVIGQGGHFAEGIPEATIELSNETGVMASIVANETGHFSFESVPYGSEYRLDAFPPDWLLFMDGVRPGYLANSTYNVSISGPRAISEVLLPYREFDEVQWLDIAEVSPLGDNISVDAPIVIVFSDPVNRTTFEEGFSITPPVSGLSFNYPQGGSVAVLQHDPFLPNTTYGVIIEGGVLSAAGAPMREYAPYSWEFTTGSGGGVDLIFDVIVEVTEVKDVHFSVVGKSDLNLFVVIEEVGSFEIPSVLPGIYEVLVAGSNFEWNTTYSFHLSDAEGGEDIAPEFAGEFTTPEEPEGPPVWELYTAKIKVDSIMNWNITATGAPDLYVFLVVIDVGSVMLGEEEPGVYKGTMGGAQFEWGETYYYYFSDESEGLDLAPELAGSRTMPDEPIVDDDDTDDDTGDDDDDLVDLLRRSGLFAGLCCGIVLMVIILAIILLIVGSRRGKKDADWEE